MKRRNLCCFLLACVGALLAHASRVQAKEPAQPARPRLVVLISIDQFRADYLTRFADLYLPPRTGSKVGGFRYLASAGAWYPDCQYEHHRTVTAAGHAILGTGAQPYVNGIVGNSWYDQSAGKSVYCVSDPQSRVVGAGPSSKETPMSAANLLVSTVGDELELATGGRAKTVSLSLKDRAAILMIGHRADAPLWFDEVTGGLISSSYYFPSGKLPAWADDFNKLHLADELRSRPWLPSVSAEALRRVWNPKGGPVSFNHPLTGKDYTPFTLSPGGNEFILQAARRAVEAEQLGWDEIPDLLTINLASNDYVGHKYGPDSPEALDISVRTDRQLSEFFQFLNGRVPGGLSQVTIAICADHGVVNVPELNWESHVPAGRQPDAPIRAAAQQALTTAVGPADWVASMDNGELYLSDEAVRRYPNVPRARLQAIAADAVSGAPHVMYAVAKSRVLSGEVAHNALGDRISKGVHPRRSGDVVIILDPQWLSGGPTGSGTSHGTPFTYDTHVPLLLCGFGVRSGTYGARVSPARLAPTFSHLLGVARPSGADEPLLPGLANVVP